MTLSSAFYPVSREILSFAYIRLSDDNEGTMRSPQTQWDGIVRTSVKFGIPLPSPERIFTDRNLSAADPNVVRLAYRRMLKAVERVDAKKYEVVILSYCQDRVFRQPADWQHFAELVGADNLDGRLITDYDGNVDLGTLGFFGVGMSYGESAKTRKRTRDGIRKSAESGRSHGQVAYGWKREYDHAGTGKPVVTTTLFDEQAQVIRDAADRILAGESLRRVARDLNAANVPPPGAGKILRRDPATREAVEWADAMWTPQKLRQILVRPANKGVRRTTSGKGARQSTEDYKGDWPAILGDDVFDTLVAKLNDPERRTVLSNTAKYLLSGIATCGVCEKAVTAQANQSAKGGARSNYKAYRCMHAHVVKSATQTEALVVTEILHLLSQPEVRASLSEPDDTETTDALAREAGLLARRDEAADDYAEGRIDRLTLARVTSNIGTQLDEIRRTVNRKRDTAVYSDLLSASADDLERVWEELYSVERKRSVIRALFDIKLLPNELRGTNAFDPTKVIIELRPMKR